MEEASNLAVVTMKAYDLNLWILPHAAKFAKTYRFWIGDNMVSTSMSLLMNLVDATYQGRNAASLSAAAKDVNRLRFLIRMSHDLRLLNMGSYAFASERLEEIGRMTGGWLKSARAKEQGRPQGA